jgi:hypothetical protein
MNVYKNEMGPTQRLWPEAYTSGIIDFLSFMLGILQKKDSSILGDMGFGRPFVPLQMRGMHKLKRESARGAF